MVLKARRLERRLDAILTGSEPGIVGAQAVDT